MGKWGDVREIVVAVRKLSEVLPVAALVHLHPDPERIVVGFDDLQQALNALKSFADCISGRKSPSQRNRYVHMDILTRMNIDNY